MAAAAAAAAEGAPLVRNVKRALQRCVVLECDVPKAARSSSVYGSIVSVAGGTPGHWKAKLSISIFG